MTEGGGGQSSVKLFSRRALEGKPSETSMGCTLDGYPNSVRRSLGGGATIAADRPDEQTCRDGRLSVDCNFRLQLLLALTLILVCRRLL